MKACALSRSNTESMGTCAHLQLLFWKLYLALNIYVEASVQMGCSPKIHIHKPLHDKINKMALAKQKIITVPNARGIGLFWAYGFVTNNCPRVHTGKIV